VRGIVGWAVVLAGCGASSHSIGADGPSTDADADLDADVDADDDVDADTDVQDCSDADGDGYGVGDACDGPDCDDSNPAVWTVAQCDTLCADGLHTSGCACNREEFPEPELCYDGVGDTLGVGPCRAGLKVCTGEVWGPCEGQVLPAEEVCNDVDDDCDGEVDGVEGCLMRGNLCLTNDGGATTWCGIDCGGGEPCPSETECADIGDGAGGIAGRQCVPLDLECSPEDQALCPPFCASCDSDDECAAAPTCR